MSPTRHGIKELFSAKENTAQYCLFKKRIRTLWVPVGTIMASHWKSRQKGPGYLMIHEEDVGRRGGFQEGLGSGP